MKSFLKRTIQTFRFYPRLFFDTRQKVFVLIYHRVLPTFYDDPWTTVVSQESFMRQLDSFAKHFNILSLRELDKPTPPKDKRNSLVLTFDDVYWDSYDIVFPILLQKGIPAIFSVVTDFIEGKRPIWDRALLILLTQKNADREISFRKLKWKQKWGESRLSFALRIFRSMKYKTAQERYALLDTLGYEKNLGEASISWGQLRKMAQNGMELGSHTVSHGSLVELSPVELSLEIEGSKRMIEEETGFPCHYFSFPYGGKLDFNADIIDDVKKSGYKACFLNISGYHALPWSHFYFKRCIVKEDGHDLLFLR